jgi:hypothetical protein
VLTVRGLLRQYRHDFDGALEDLGAACAGQPPRPRATCVARGDLHGARGLPGRTARVRRASGSLERAARNRMQCLR